MSKGLTIRTSLVSEDIEKIVRYHDGFMWMNLCGAGDMASN